ncbi:DNA primase family protein, partial [Aeromonas caviae]|uniref:DNA primase family protein n=1 Tax=Aeromonas caviae TaxID=648 RepID=UPI0038D10676
MTKTLAQLAAAVEANGHAVIPMGENGNPRPYGDGQKYAAFMVNGDHDRFGVRLDRAVLVDLDGNKVKGAPTPAELLRMIHGDDKITDEEAISEAVQWREVDGRHDGSFHWVYRLPEGVDLDGLKKCVTDALKDHGLPGVDIKTGNQLIYVKRGKTLKDSTIEPLAEMMETPPFLLQLMKPTVPARTEFAPVTVTGETTRYGKKSLAGALEAVANAPQGTRNETLNRETMKIAQLVAGGEIAANDAAELERAALAAGMGRVEVVYTIRSATAKGMSEPRKAPERKIEARQNVPHHPLAGKGGPLRPEPADASTQDLDPDTLSKMPANKLGRIIAKQLGTSAVCRESGIVYRYGDGVWLPVSDARLAPMLAEVFDHVGATYTAKKLNGAVETMKVGLPEMEAPTASLIGFANGVYDLKACQFRAHSPSDHLPSHNGIEYGEPLAGETLERHAPNFIKWLSHAAGGDPAKMDRILAALYMVLANRYDWQMFLEVTGEGGSGKSVMANLCELLVGKENVGSTSMEAMRGQFGLENVWDKRLILLPDQSQYIGDGALLKAITGGDEVSINRKNKAQFNAKVRAVVIATNNEPMKMTERNGGISRRRVIFAFNNVVSEANKDPAIGDKIAAELPVIIRHLLAQFADPEQARQLLLEQRDGAEALAVKQ